MPGGRCPSSLEAEFCADVVAGLSPEDLEKKYQKRPRTIRSWIKRLREAGKLPKTATRRTLKDEPRHSVEYTEEGNFAKAASSSERIRTLDELLEAADVDLEVWRVKDWGVKKWEVGAKIKKGQLNWEDGGIVDGHLSYEGLGVQDLWSVWAKFVRRELVPLHASIQPVDCSFRFRRPELHPLGSKVQRALVCADPQMGYSRDVTTGQLDPYHDRAALDLVLQLAAVIQPERIIVLGDFLDLPNMTDKFLRAPECEQTAQPAVCEGHWFLRRLREACPDSRITLHEGNHDARLGKAILTHLRAVYGLKPADELDMPPALSPERLLALHQLGIEWIGDYPNDDEWLNPGLRLNHGDVARAGPMATAAAIVKDSDVSTMCGHIHRSEKASRTLHTRGGMRTITAYCLPCVCRIDGAVPSRKKRENWQQGCAVVDFTEVDYNVTDVPFRDRRAVWAGEVYEADDWLPALQEDLPLWNW